MDTSPENIKKCKKAKEIQKQRPLGCFPPDIWEDGDYFAIGTEVRVFHHISFDEGYIEDLIRERGRIWLPTQSQLQEMVGDYGYCLNLLHDFQCPEVNFPDVYSTFTSMEQLWLAFVMNENYCKVWDFKKEEWIPNEPEGK